MKRFSFIAFGLALVISASVTPAQNEPVAVIATDTVTVAEFQQVFGDYLLKTGVRDNASLRRSMLSTIISSVVLAKEALLAGAENDLEYTAYRNEVDRKLLVDAYARKVLFDRIEITDADLEDLFVRANSELTASHLYASNKIQADSLYQMLQAGVLWDDLAKQVFTDTTLANSGGSVGTFTFDEMDPAFEDAAFLLRPGEISKPVKTAMGYSIIRLDDRFTKPLLTEYEFATQKDKLTGHARVRKQRAAREAHGAEVLSELKVDWNEPVLQKTVAWIRGELAPAAGERPDDLMSQSLVEFGTGDSRQTWTVADLRESTSLLPAARRQGLRNVPGVKETIEGLMIQMEIVTRGRALGLSSLPEFKAARNRNLRDWLVRWQISRLNEGIEIPADTIRAYFDVHHADFQSEEKVHITEILVRDLDLSRKIVEDLESTPFGDLASVHTERPGAAEQRGVLGYLSRTELGGLADFVWEKTPGTVVGPREVAGAYVVLLVGDRQMPVQKTFEEAAPEISELLWQSVADDLMRDYRHEMEEKYSSEITIFDDVLFSLSPFPNSTDETTQSNPN